MSWRLQEVCPSNTFSTGGADSCEACEGGVSEELVALDFPPEAPPAAQEAPAEAQERQAV